MRYADLAELGGFLWWIIVKFTRTNLNDQQSKENWSRNIFFLIIIIFAIGFISVKFIK